MRHFSEQEQQVIRQIVESMRNGDFSNFCLDSVIYECVDCFAIEWKTSDYDYEIKVLYTDSHNSHTIIRQLLDILCLIKYLEDNGLVLMSKISTGSSKKQLYDTGKYERDEDGYKLIISKEPIKLGNMLISNRAEFIHDESSIHIDLSLLFDRYVHSIIYPTYELQEYVDNGFKTPEDKKYENQRCLTWIGIITAIIIGVGGMILSCCNPAKLNKRQYQHLIETIQTTNNYND